MRNAQTLNRNHVRQLKIFGENKKVFLMKMSQKKTSKENPKRLMKSNVFYCSGFFPLLSSLDSRAFGKDASDKRGRFHVLLVEMNIQRNKVIEFN